MRFAKGPSMVSISPKNPESRSISFPRVPEPLGPVEGRERTCQAPPSYLHMASGIRGSGPVPPQHGLKPEPEAWERPEYGGRKEVKPGF